MTLAWKIKLRLKFLLLKIDLWGVEMHPWRRQLAVNQLRGIRVRIDNVKVFMKRDGCTYFVE